MTLDLVRIERIAEVAQGRYDPEILAECAVYHGNAAMFVAQVGTPDVVLALVARIRELQRDKNMLEMKLRDEIQDGESSSYESYKAGRREAAQWLRDLKAERDALATRVRVLESRVHPDGCMGCTRCT